MFAKNPLLTAEYHDFEIAVSGFSGAGKTTLIVKLLEAFRAKYKVAFVKSDAHRFEMDVEGKDTQRAWQAGARGTAIFDKTHTGLIQEGSWDLIERRQLFLNYDFVLVEGRKRSALPKLVMLGGRDDIRPLISSGELEPILAFVGESIKRPAEVPAAQPYFYRDAVAEIAEFIERYFLEMSFERPLKALLLAGGESRRMQRDKALLRFEGETQLARAENLLKAVVGEVFVSARPGQRGGQILEDQMTGLGPLGGILSAQRAEPQTAWLVLACDLPKLEAGTLHDLIAGRRPLRLATAFRSTSDEMPEPLCAIYEPRSHLRFMQMLGLGMVCPRKMLMNSHVELLQLRQREALTNMNTPEDYAGVIGGEPLL